MSDGTGRHLLLYSFVGSWENRSYSFHSRPCGIFDLKMRPHVFFGNMVMLVCFIVLFGGIAGHSQSTVAWTTDVSTMVHGTPTRLRRSRGSGSGEIFKRNHWKMTLVRRWSGYCSYKKIYQRINFIASDDGRFMFMLSGESFIWIILNLTFFFNEFDYQL